MQGLPPKSQDKRSVVVSNPMYKDVAEATVAGLLTPAVTTNSTLQCIHISYV